MNLDLFLMRMATEVAAQSGDLDNKVGCVITDKDGRVLVTGFNDLPSGCSDEPDRRCRPHKYHWTEHAERRALNHAARFGIAVDRGTAITTYFPCDDCARSMVDSGITRVVAPHPDLTHARWGACWQRAVTMFTEAGVEVVHMEVPDVSE